jgi:tRNA-dihydrouridine synthase B
MNVPICFAPMVGLSHVATRRLIQRYTPKEVKTIWPTEMLNSRKVDEKTLSNSLFMKKHESEQSLVPQILGNEERAIRTAIQTLNDWGAVGIDINMGCPVRKALRHNYGVALMGDSDYAAKVVAMAAASSSLPVSVKLRAGSQNNLDFLSSFAKGLVDAGAQWLTLHPRTPEQKRRGQADWNQIKFLKQNIGVPVIGNGDIQTHEDVFQMLKDTGCDAVMVGRALCARPWMIWQVAERLGLSSPLLGRFKAPQTPAEEGHEYGQALLFLIDELRQHFKEDLGVRKLKFYIRHTHMWLTFGHTLDKNISKAMTYNDGQKIIEDFFTRPQLMMKKTNLRI